MSVNLFNTGGSFFQPDDINNSSGSPASATLYLDGGEPLNFYMIQRSQGDQAARIQIDATLDGGLYAIGVNGGIGTYNMLFLDGLSTTNCNASNQGSSKDSVMSKYLKLRSLKSRRAAIYIYPPSAQGRASTKCAGVFDGLVQNMQVQLQEDDSGSVSLYVSLSVTGGWRTV